MFHLREFGCTICENVIRDVDNFLTNHTTEEQISSFVQGVSIAVQGQPVMTFNRVFSAALRSPARYNRDPVQHLHRGQPPPPHQPLRAESADNQLPSAPHRLLEHGRVPRPRQHLPSGGDRPPRRLLVRR